MSDREPSKEALEIADPLAGLAGSGVLGKRRIAFALDAFAQQARDEAFELGMAASNPLIFPTDGPEIRRRIEALKSKPAAGDRR